MTRVRVIGPGRLGGSLRRALDPLPGFDVSPVVGRGGDLAAAASGVDVLVLAVPDREIAAVASSVVPDEGCVVLHASGATGLEALGPHPHRGGLHPLASLPDPVTGAARLASGICFGTAWNDERSASVVTGLVRALGGWSVRLPDESGPARTAYHAAAAVASNHVVAVLGQAERLAGAAGVEFAAFAGLVRGAVEDALANGAAAALTGPAARGDTATLEAHRWVVDALGGREVERPAYDAVAARAAWMAAGAPGAEPPASVPRAPTAERGGRGVGGSDPTPGGGGTGGEATTEDSGCNSSTSAHDVPMTPGTASDPSGHGPWRAA